MDSLFEAARRPLTDMAPDLAGALVLLDAGAAEVAQLSLGPSFLFGAPPAADDTLGLASPAAARPRRRCRPRTKQPWSCREPLRRSAAAPLPSAAPPNCTLPLPTPAPTHPPPAGVGAANVCDLERTSPDDALLVDMAAAASLPPGAPRPPLHVAVLVTRLLTDAHPHILHALMVGARLPMPAAAGGSGWGRSRRADGRAHPHTWHAPPPRLPPPGTCRPHPSPHPPARRQVHHAAARVTVCSALSELAHAQQAATELGVEAYREYADALRQDLAQVRL